MVVAQRTCGCVRNCATRARGIPTRPPFSFRENCPWECLDANARRALAGVVLLLNNGCNRVSRTCLFRGITRCASCHCDNEAKLDRSLTPPVFAPAPARAVGFKLDVCTRNISKKIVTISRRVGKLQPNVSLNNAKP